MAPIILIAAAGAAWLLLRGSPDKTAPGSAKPAGASNEKATPASASNETWTVPPEILADETGAVAAGDPAAMRRVAGRLRKLGTPEAIKAAESLEAAAALIEAGQKTPKQTSPAAPETPVAPVIVAKSPGLPQPPQIAAPAMATLPTPVIALPSPVLPVPSAALPAPAETAPLSPRRQAADALVRYLADDPPYQTSDSRLESLMASYVTSLGQSATGGNLKYGPGTAKTLAELASGSHTPPTPRYWPKASYTKAIKDYEAWLSMKAAEDPARSSEWLSARARARDFYPSGSTAKRS